jgi:DNA helicase IV
VAEPAAIVAEASGSHGLRHLYVALTRPTQTLTVVHAQALPEPFS